MMKVQAVARLLNPSCKISKELTLENRHPFSFAKSQMPRQWRRYLLHYGVALVSRIDKMIGLFCKRALQKRRYSAKETYHFIDPTDRSHPISNPTKELTFENRH